MTADADVKRRAGWLAPRHPGDFVRVALALLVLVVSAVFVHRDRVGVHETDVFRVINDLPGALFPLLWPVMQLGNIVAVPIVAAAAAAFRRFRLAAEIAVAGAGVWLLAKVVKGLIVRGRPEALLPDVHIHGAAATGRGYLSGHAAVVFAVVTLISPYLGRRGRRAIWLLAITVCIARVYTGAHLPLDVVAGAALGWGAASAVHLLLGAPSGRPSVRSLRRALQERGFAAATLVPIDLDSRRSARFVVTTDAGERLFVKVMPRERRDVDLLYRCWLALRGRRSAEGYRTPAQQAAHEAAMGMLAAAAGARVPRVLAVGRYGNGTGLLVTEWVDAEPLGVKPVASAVVVDAWRQLAALRATRLAHRRLEPSNILVDSAHQVWLVDFGGATVPASPALLGRDATQMFDSLAAYADRTTVAVAAKDALADAEPMPASTQA